MQIQAPFSLCWLAIVLFPPALPAQPASSPWTLPNFAQRLEMDISNPSAQSLRALAAVSVREAARVAPGFPGSLAIVTIVNPSGYEYPFSIAPSQVDDLDGDGSPDELLFSVDLAPGETRRAHIYYSTTLHDSIPYPKEVDAAGGFGYNHQTAALESTSIGYRTYGGFLLDVQARAKRHPGLNNTLVGYFGSANHTPAGLDVLHVGDTLGLGGIFLRRGDQVYRPPFNTPDYAHRPSPSEVPKYRVVASGPLRATIEATMDRWSIGSDAVRLSARYSIAASQEFVNCEVSIEPLQLAAESEYEVGAGILELPGKHRDFSPGRIATSGTQEAKIGPLALALFFESQEARTVPQVHTGDGTSAAVVFPSLLRAGQPVRLHYQVAAAWSGSGIANLFAHLRAVEQQARQRVKLSRFAFTLTPDPRRIEGEAY
jgi:hypothetical protein